MANERTTLSDILTVRVTKADTRRIKTFCRELEISDAALVRVGIKHLLGELMNGRAAIVNGKLKPIRK